MRTLLALVLVSACTSASPSGTEMFDSVRDRLSSNKPTAMFVTPAASSGEIAARRWSSGGWIEGTTVVTIEGGVLAGSLDAAGRLALEDFEVSVDPIELPEEVFNKPAQLSDVRVRLSKPVTGAIAWSSDDDATATLTLDLDLDWAIAVNGGKTPLGTQHLPPIAIDVTLTGAGDHVDATVGLAASGQLWNWAGLLELTRLQLAVTAATPD